MIINFLRNLCVAIFGGKYCQDDYEIVDDVNLINMSEREEVALISFKATVHDVASTRDISRMDAACHLMTSVGVDLTNLESVREYFWKTGMSNNDVDQYLNDFLRLHKD